MPTCTLQLPPALCLARIARQRLGIAVLGAVLTGLGAPMLVQAQSAPPAAGEAPSDRAKRDADKVYDMIRMHADRPRRAAVSVTPTTLPGPAAAATPPLGNGANPALTAAAAAPADSAARRAIQADSAARTASLAPALAVSPAAPVLDTTLAMQQLATSAAALSDSAKPANGLLPAANALVLVSSVDPAFPSHLIRRLGQGSVVVNFDVRPDGTVASTAIAKTSHAGLNEAAKAAVAAWRFKPVSAMTGGVTELRFE